MVLALQPYQVDELVDLIREVRVILRNEDLEDADIAEAMRAGLNILGVADDEDS